MTVSEKHMGAAKALIEERINSMCLTWDHSFGLMDEAQREGLRRSFRQIAYHDLTPFIAAALAAAEREGMRISAMIAAIHSQYPIENDYDKGYAQGAKDAHDRIVREVNSHIHKKEDASK